MNHWFTIDQMDENAYIISEYRLHIIRPQIQKLTWLPWKLWRSCR